MAGLVKVTAVLPRLSGLPEDAVANNFHFQWENLAPPDASVWNSLRDRLVSFYNDFEAPAIASISSYISEAITRATNGCRFDFYFQDGLLFDGSWASPVATRTWTLDLATVSTPLPAEVAACLSFHADLTDVPESATNPDPPPAIIRPASRLRGRLFIGPLIDECVTEQFTTHEALVAPGFTNAMLGAAHTLLEDNDANFTWTVFSAANGTGQPVVGGYVDDAFDTQRRRGNDATVRTNWT